MKLSQFLTLKYVAKAIQSNPRYYNKIRFTYMSTESILEKPKVCEEADNSNTNNNEVEIANNTNNKNSYDVQRMLLKDKIRTRKIYKFNSNQLNTGEEDPNNNLTYQFDDKDKDVLMTLSSEDINNISPDLNTESNVTLENNQINKYDLKQDQFNYDEYFHAFNKLITPLDKCEEDLSSLGPGLSPTFNFAAYADKSELVQTYIKLGVELYKVEQNQDHMRALLSVSLNDELPKYLQFFHDSGVPGDHLGKIITMNPMILKEDLDDMQFRIRYLKAHNFTQASIARIVTKNPTWLTWATKHIDERLGHFQNEFKLSGPEIRFLATKQPKIITYNIKHINESTFSFLEEMGFCKSHVKIILLSKPRIWMQNRNKTLKTFDYLHTTMNISHDRILSNVEILTCRVNRLKNRHEFLSELKKVQYNPENEGYISLKALANGSDTEFCRDVAKIPIATYNLFLKTR